MKSKSGAAIPLGSRASYLQTAGWAVLEGLHAAGLALGAGWKPAAPAKSHAGYREISYKAMKLLRESLSHFVPKNGSEANDLAAGPII